ncbi:MAG: helix-turn-helix domain-containing protein, partial [Clostridia bacterium]|nr:helix-turn-helix domain-containing protein [Clostridia bacterium]
SYWESGKFEPDNDSLLKLASFYNVSTDYLLGRNENAPAESKGKWINVYGNIAAGIPIEAIEDVIDQEEISAEMAHHGEYIALRVKGSSMEPRIMDGDVVIIRLQPDIENGEIAAVFVNGNEVTLKQIKRDENGLWLVPLNPAHAPMYYTQKECAELPIRILGKMVELRAKF